MYLVKVVSWKEKNDSYFGKQEVERRVVTCSLALGQHAGVNM
jgi:hypothetical protein